MDTTLFLEAFGRLTPDTAVIVAEEEDLHSVFRARSELMGWSTLSGVLHPQRWNMHEAALANGDDSTRMGWTQVGVSRDPVGTLPALSQCLVDALRRFGEVAWSGLQVTIRDLEPHTRTNLELFATHNWFHVAPRTRPTAHLAVDQGLLGDLTAAELAAYLQQWNTGAFTFGPVIHVPGSHRIQTRPRLPLHPARLGLTVTLPEWTASAVGWVMAFVLDHARALTPTVRACAVRITRT